MIQVINNFFEEETFKEIQQKVTTNLMFSPRYFNPKGEKNEENYYGSRFILSADKYLEKLFIKTAEKKFKIKIKKLHEDSGIDIRNLSNFTPHIDDGIKVNVLIMIYGPTAVTNGTVFYTDGELDIHIGFRENRALMFDSNIYHSQHASKIPNLKRYTSTLFIEDYELI